MSYFWKRNKETKVYELIDEELEEELAELLGVEIYDEEKEKAKAKSVASRALTEQEIKDFKDELAHASQELKTFFSNNTTVPSEEESEDSDSDSDSTSHTTP